MSKASPSVELILFFEAEIHNCTAPNGSGEPTTLATASGTLAQIPVETLLELIDQGEDYDVQEFYDDFAALLDEHGDEADMMQFIA